MPLFLECNQLPAEILNDRPLYDGRFAEAAESPEFAPDGVLEGRNFPRKSSIPKYNSKPNAPATLYLDFRNPGEARRDPAGEPADGSETSECEFVDGSQFDGPGAFNAIEARVVVEIWQAIAEKFAKFNVNVTTVDSGEASAIPTRRVAVGRLYRDYYRSMLQYR